MSKPVVNSHTLINILPCVFLGGMIGVSLRYGFSTILSHTQELFPWITFAENITGAFLLGVAMILILSQKSIDRRLYYFVCTGILGSFTTFSAINLEAIELYQTGRSEFALVYILLSTAVGLCAVFIGMSLGNRMLKSFSANRR